MIKVYGYKKCSTVNKAVKYIEEKGFKIEFFDFVLNQIPKEILVDLIKTSNLDIDDFFSKNGVVFKELDLAKKIPLLSYDDKLDLLLSSGKLIKRPIIRIDDKIIVGFNKNNIEIINELLK